MPESKPRRIQLRRTAGWTKPAGAVVVSRPSKWGNPYPLSDYAVAGTSKQDREQRARTLSVRDFEAALHAGRLPFSVEDVRRELRGKSLCCWCPLPRRGEPDVCHAAVLLAVANERD